MNSDSLQKRVLTSLAAELGTSVERLESHPITRNVSNPDSLELVELVANLRDAFQRDGFDEATSGSDDGN